MLGLKLIHVVKRGPRQQLTVTVDGMASEINKLSSLLGKYLSVSVFRVDSCYLKSPYNPVWLLYQLIDLSGIMATREQAMGLLPDT